MINWYSAGFSAMWIIGLSFVTAGLSSANYLRSLQNWSFRRAVQAPHCRIMIRLGLVFFCLGLAGSVSTLWEHILWIVLAVDFALQTWLTRKIGNP